MKTHSIKKTLTRQFSLLTCTVSVAWLAGCASGNYQKGSAAGAGLQASATKITEGMTKIDAATTSLNDLVNNPGDLAAQFKTFSASVSSLESASKEVQGKVKAMREEGNAYFAAWDQETATIHNEDIKNRSAERKAEMQQKFMDIKRSYVEAQDQFKPFLSNMMDIQTALSTDLTPGGVDAIKNTATKVIQEGSSLKATLTKLSEQFRDVGAAMSASMPQPTTQ